MKDYQINLPCDLIQESFVPAQGVPRKISTWILRALLALVFLLVMAIPILLIFDESAIRDVSFFILSLLTVMFVLGATGFAIVLYFSGSKVDSTLSITSEGLIRTNSPSADIMWNSISKSERTFDVTIEKASTPRSMNWYLLIGQYKIPGHLQSSNKISTGFQNVSKLQRKILINLAHHKPSLSFDPMVFVQLGVDPETWKPMLWPKRIYNLLNYTIIIPMFAYFYFVPKEWLQNVMALVGVIAAGVFLVLMPSALLVAYIWSKIFPRFSDCIITFK